MSTRPAVETEAPNRRILTPLVRAHLEARGPADDCAQE